MKSLGIVLDATRDGTRTRLRLTFVTLAEGERALYYYDLPLTGPKVPIVRHYGSFLPLLDACLKQGHHSFTAAESAYRLDLRAVKRLWRYAAEEGVIEDDGRLWAPVRPQALARPSALAEHAAFAP